MQRKLCSALLCSARPCLISLVPAGPQGQPAGWNPVPEPGVDSRGKSPVFIALIFARTWWWTCGGHPLGQPLRCMLEAVRCREDALRCDERFLRER